MMPQGRDIFDDPAISRYHRQVLLPGIGAEGQKRLGESHAVLVGVGALGCASADLLARAGIGTITLIDRDVVELTNLQRQTLYTEQDARDGVPKAVAAAARLGAVNSIITVRPIVADFAGVRARTVLEQGPPAGVLIDGTDNFETRYLLNDLSVKLGIPLVYGGVVGTLGMAATFVPGDGPCLRCVFPQLPAPGSAPTCDTAGVLGSSVAIVAACQAADAMKILLGRTDTLSRSLLDFDLWTNRRRRLDLANLKDPACPCCALRRFEFLDGAAASDAAVLCGQNAVQIAPAISHGDRPIDLSAISARLRPHGKVSINHFLVRASLSGEREPIELTVFQDGRAIVKGTMRPEVARSIYAKFVGA